MKLRAIFMLALSTAAFNAGAVPIAIDLGTAGDFALLGGASIVNSNPSTFITGDVGVSPGATVTGFLPVTNVDGNLYLAANTATGQAQSDALGAYNAAANPLLPRTELTGQNLGTLGSNLDPGVYFFSSAAAMDGVLTLDARGDSSAQWIFQVGSALDVAAGSSLLLLGGADACNVFWQVGSSATLQSGAVFAGTILALTSITMNGGELDGRALALNGSIAIAGQQIVDSTCAASETTVPVVPEPASLALISLGLCAGVWRRKFRGVAGKKLQALSL